MHRNEVYVVLSIDCQRLRSLQDAGHSKIAQMCAEGEYPILLYVKLLILDHFIISQVMGEGYCNYCIVEFEDPSKDNK